MTRGLASIFFNVRPDESTFSRGLLILSCSEAHALDILRFAKTRHATTHWTILYRYDATGAFRDDNIIFSSDADSVGKKLQLLRQIRVSEYDIIYVAWTNEPSFSFLKIFALFSGFGYLKIIDEHLNAFYLLRADVGSWRGHMSGRWRNRKGRRSILLNVLSWIVLFPLGIMFVVARTVYFSFRLLSGRRSSQHRPIS